MNILIVKLSAIGDVIHTLPSLAALRKLYPEAHITWVVEEAAADIIINHPYLDRTIVSRRIKWIGDFQRGNIITALREMRSFFNDLRGRKYDMVIDFHGLFKSAIIVCLSGGKRKLGYDGLQELSGLFYNEKIPEDMGKHAVDRYLDFIRYLGGSVGKPEFLIPIMPADRQKADQLLESKGFDKGERFVAVNPVALWETKLWDDRKFAGLCDRLYEEMRMRVILTGKEKAHLDRIHSLMKTPGVNLGGKTSLRELACLYQSAALVITTDSGPMHLAAAIGTPVIAIFGPTDPSRTGPYGEDHRVIRKDLICSPCFLKNCDTMDCMKDISVDVVYEAVKHKLEGL